MSEPTPLEQLTFAELRAEAGNTISALITASGTQIDPTAILRLGYFMACVGEGEFTVRLISGTKEPPKTQTVSRIRYTSTTAGRVMSAGMFDGSW